MVNFLRKITKQLLIECLRITIKSKQAIRLVFQKKNTKLQVQWRCQITVHYFQIIQILCLMLCCSAWQLLQTISLMPLTKIHFMIMHGNTIMNLQMKKTKRRNRTSQLRKYQKQSMQAEMKLMNMYQDILIRLLILQAMIQVVIIL